MDTLTDWLMAMIQPIVVRTMTSLGLSVITFTGVTTAFEQARDYVKDGINAFPPAILDLMGLFGINIGLALLFGAMSFTITLWSLRKAFSFFGLGAVVS